jgi:hypothetical protein
LEKNPFRNPSFSIIVSTTVPRVISTLFIPIVQVSIDEEFYAFLNSELIGANCPIGLGFLATVKPIDVDKRAVATAVTGAKIGFTSE